MTELKKRLEAAGLNQQAIAAALGPVPNREAVEAHLRRRVDTSLVELFVLGEPVAAGKLPVPAEELEAAGLVVRDGELVRAPLRLTPHEGVLPSLHARRVDLGLGSWFGPVAGASFDLIVANPPFVISPDSSYVFRDSGLRGDDVSRDVVRGAAAHLRAGGHATVLCNWICRGAATWQPLEAFVDGTGCDALLLAHEPVEPFTY